MPKSDSGNHELSARQVAILDFIRSFVRDKGYPPSVREIGKAVGLLSTASIHNHLQKLSASGHLQRDPLKPRALGIVSDSALRQQTMVPIPLVGRVTAGQPILAEQNIEATYPLPAELIGMHSNDELFMLTVSGDSMINAGILDGDIVLVRRQQAANNGDIVVALLTEDEETTVKRFYRETNQVRLQPENDKYKPIYTSDVSILGKVVGVFRFL